MNRNIVWTGGSLIALGLIVFAWKIVVLDLPLAPSNPEGLWRVEVQLRARGAERGSLRIALPSTSEGQVIQDENLLSDRLLFTIRNEQGQRSGIWTGTLKGEHEPSYGFRVQLTDRDTTLARGLNGPPTARGAERHVEATAEFPAESELVTAILDVLDLPSEADPVGRTRTIFGYVTDEIATVQDGSDDALLALTGREASAEGKARLLVTLLRGAGVPARQMQGLRLRDGYDPLRMVWAEAALGSQWVPMVPAEGLFAVLPDDLLTLRVGSDPLVHATGVEAVTHRYRAIRERMRPDELEALMVPQIPWLASFSLYRLPVDIQEAFRILMVVPLAALGMAIFRNLIGVRAFGTFLPILLALALRATGLVPGLAMIAAVIALGVVARLAMDRLHLLLVPRLSVLLCVVILATAFFALIGRGLEAPSLFGGVLFPIVILTMLVERFSINVAEEGLRLALQQLFWTVSISCSVYPLFRSTTIEHLMFGFPELVVVVMGTLVLLGGYSGYRLFELRRFRAVLGEDDR